MSYHLSGPRFFVPRDKATIIKLIVESGKWNDTKVKLRAKEMKELRGIFYRIRNEQLNGLMKFEKTKPIVQDGYIPEQKMEV